jgi:hypothetical protein
MERLRGPDAVTQRRHVSACRVPSQETRMNRIKSKDWEYDLFQEGDSYFVDVVCGTVALYNRRVTLTSDEARRAETDESYLIELVNSVRRDPSRFAGRYVDGVRMMP